MESAKIQSPYRILPKIRSHSLMFLINHLHFLAKILKTENKTSD